MSSFKGFKKTFFLFMWTLFSIIFMMSLSVWGRRVMYFFAVVLLSAVVFKAFRLWRVDKQKSLTKLRGGKRWISSVMTMNALDLFTTLGFVGLNGEGIGKELNQLFAFLYTYLHNFTYVAAFVLATILLCSLWVVRSRDEAKHISIALILIEFLCVTNNAIILIG